MERANRIARFWNWLPAFRAVAETQHLPSAAQEIHVSTSALSRTVRLLEDEIGRPLFDRVGRDIVLNQTGEVLLGACRNAMRLFDEVLEQLDTSELRGSVVVSCSGPMVPVFVLPALAAIGDRYPQVRIHVTSVSAGLVNSEIRRGGLDIALVTNAQPDPQLEIEALATIGHGLHTAPSHPLARKRKVALGDLEEHLFVAPPHDEGPGDAWPTHSPRTVGLVVSQMQAGIDACMTGSYIAVLPDSVGERHRLRRLPVDIIPDTTLCMVHRKSLPMKTRSDVVADALRDFATSKFPAPTA